MSMAEDLADVQIPTALKGNQTKLLGRQLPQSENARTKVLTFSAGDQSLQHS
jgi:hypothetical protein